MDTISFGFNIEFRKGIPCRNQKCGACSPRLSISLSFLFWYPHVEYYFKGKEVIK